MNCITPINYGIGKYQNNICSKNHNEHTPSFKGISAKQCKFKNNTVRNLFSSILEFLGMNKKTKMVNKNYRKPYVLHGEAYSIFSERELNRGHWY